MLTHLTTVPDFQGPQPSARPSAPAPSRAGFVGVQLLFEVGIVALPITVLLVLLLAFCHTSPDGTLGFGSAPVEHSHRNVADLSVSSAGTALYRTNAGPVLLDLESGEELIAMPLPSENVSTVAQSADGRFLAAGYTDGSIAVCWNREDPSCVRTALVHENQVQSLAFSPDGDLLASGGRDGAICLLAANTGAVLHRLAAHPLVEAVCFARDQRYLASAGDDGQARVWDIGSGAVVQTCTGHEGPIMGLAFSPEGTELITGGNDGTIRRWNWRSGEEVWKSPNIWNAIFELVVSPDGRTMASCGLSSLRLWDVRSGRTQELAGHTGAVRCVAFSAEGRHLLSAACDGTLRVWDVRTGRELRHKRHNIGSESTAGPLLSDAGTELRPL